MRRNPKTGAIEFDDQDALAEIKYYLENEKKFDLNKDGVVDDKDLKALKKFLAGATDADIDAALADINGDGVVNAKDIAALKKAIAALKEVK